MKQIKLTIKSSMGKFLIIPLLFLFSTMIIETTLFIIKSNKREIKNFNADKKRN